MIDTITIMITDYQIVDYSIFKEYRENYIREFFAHPKRKCFQLEAKLQPALSSLYKVSITLVSNKHSFKLYKNAQMYISFSAPKQLFNNNLYELKESNYLAVVNILIDILNKLKIMVTTETIENASVRRVDYSKNFILQQNITCADVINLVRYAHLKRFILFNVIDGKYVKFESKTMAISFYDKLEEMKEHCATAPHLTEIMLMAEHRILRIEVQFKKAYGVKGRLRKICNLLYPNNLKLKDIFNEETFKKVFEDILKEIYKRLPLIIHSVAKAEQLKDMFGKKSNEISKKMSILNCQEECGSYEKGIEEATKIYGEKFVERNKCILVYNEKLPFILFEFLEEIRNYKPLFNTS